MRISIVVLLVSVSYLVAGCGSSLSIHAGYEAQAQRLKTGQSLQQNQRYRQEGRVANDGINELLKKY